jgi:UDP-3-O-[3-hydroxymyristoyl] glucosamine N-acyltransferase
MKEFSATQVAALVNGTIDGDESCRISGVAALAEAESHHLSFLGNSQYTPQVLPSKAGVVIVESDFNELPPKNRCWVVVENASAAFSTVVSEFAPPAFSPSPGIHRGAVVDPGVVVPDDVHIGPNAVIEAGVIIGAGAVIGAGCYVGWQVNIGAGCRLHPNAVVLERCVLGDRVIIHSGTVIGSDGYGFIPGTVHQKIPQVGIVQIDDDVEIGSNVSVDRARFGRTWIKAGAKIDNLVHLAHNVVIGERCFIVAQVGLSGSVVVGDDAILAGQAGVVGHVTIGDRAVVMGGAAVWDDVEPGTKVVGDPAAPRMEYLRQLALIKRLPDLLKRLDALERRFSE